MEISGYMRQMPPSASKHGLSIKTNKFDRRDCRSTEPTWNPFKQRYGPMNNRYSQVGDLDPIIDDANGNASYRELAWGPTFNGGYPSIRGRSIAIYESWDGTYEKLFEEPIACCNIQTFYLLLPETKSSGDEAARKLAIEEGTEVITVEEYEQMFGEKFDANQHFAIGDDDIEATFADNGKK